MNPEAEAVIPQVVVLIRQGLWSEAAALLRSVGVEPMSSSTRTSAIDEIDEHTWLSAPAMAFEINGVYYRTDINECGMASWEDYHCNVSGLGELDEINPSELSCYSEVKTVLDTIRQGNFATAFRMIAESVDF